MLPQCPRELKSATPAAVFVSEPKLWETENNTMKTYYTWMKRDAELTPGKYKSDRGVRAHRDQKGGEVSHAVQGHT